MCIISIQKSYVIFIISGFYCYFGVFISSKNCLLWPLGSLIGNIILSTNRGDVTSFPIYIISPYFFSCFSDLAKTSRTILVMCGENEHPCPIYDPCINALCFLPFNIMLTKALFCIDFIMLKYIPFLISSGLLSEKDTIVYQRLILHFFEKIDSCPLHDIGTKQTNKHVD